MKHVKITGVKSITFPIAFVGPKYFSVRFWFFYILERVFVVIFQDHIVQTGTIKNRFCTASTVFSLFPTNVRVFFLLGSKNTHTQNAQRVEPPAARA